MSSHELTQFLRTAEEAAKIGGDVLRSWAARFTVSEKSRANLVTEADFASQEAIHRHIRERYPDHGFLGEEGLSESRGESAYRWVVDPLDGTSNYVHGFPYYCVSIGLQQGEELVVGVIFDPNRDETFAAYRGGGATLNGEPIRPSSVDRLGHAMTMASLPVAVTADDPAVLRFVKMLPQAQTVQRTGSAALNLAYVAAGRIDGYWSSSLKAWDMAAGVVIVTEAGGRVTRLSGLDFRLDLPEVLATNGTALHEEMLQQLG